ADADRKLSRYAQERQLPFYPWLCRLADERLDRVIREHTAGIRDVRAERPRGLQAADGTDDPLLNIPVGSGTSPTGNLRPDEIRQRVREALAGLGEADRRVLVLRHHEDLPFAEVAAALGITENAAKVRHFRALEKMKKLLDGESLG